MGFVVVVVVVVLILLFLFLVVVVVVVSVNGTQRAAITRITLSSFQQAQRWKCIDLAENELRHTYYFCTSPV